MAKSIIDYYVNPAMHAKELLLRVEEISATVNNSDNRKNTLEVIARGFGNRVTRMPLLRRAILHDDHAACARYIINEATLKLVQTGTQDHEGILIFENGFAWSATGCGGLMSKKNTDKLNGLTAFSWESKPLSAKLLENLKESKPLSRFELISTVNERAFIDYDGLLATIALSNKSRFIPLLHDRRKYTEAKLNRSLDSIHSIWPEFEGMMYNNVQCFVLTETYPRQGRIVRHGSSSTDLPGVILMNDYHFDEISDAELAENIVHESVHNTLFSFEDVKKWYCEDRAHELQHTVKSVWSSRTLPIYSFYHSLIVMSAVQDWNRLAMRSGMYTGSSSLFLIQRERELENGFQKLASTYHSAIESGEFPLSVFGLELYSAIVKPRLNESHAT